MTENTNCGYCHQEQHIPACPTHSSNLMTEYNKGFQAFDWRHPIQPAYWKRFSPSFMLGYHNVGNRNRASSKLLAIDMTVHNNLNTEVSESVEDKLKYGF